MKNILIINGPNLNLIGTREVEIYGKISINEIEEICINEGKNLSINIDFRQTNNEGEIINWIHEVNSKFDGLIINPAGYTHTSIAILDSLKTVDKPKIEIHLSNIHAREDYRKSSITASAVQGTICGFGYLSYVLAIQALNSLLNN